MIEIVVLIIEKVVWNTSHDEKLERGHPPKQELRKIFIRLSDMINHKLNGTINKTKLNQVRMHKKCSKDKAKAI